MGLLRNLTVVVVLGIIASLGVLAVSGQIAANWKPSAINAPIPDPAPQPCSKQNWHNADRICLTWAAPRDETPGVMTLAGDWNRNAPLSRTP